MKNQRRTSLASCIAAGAGLALACGGGPALAADWSVNPKLTASYEYNDNTRLTDVAGNEVEVNGAGLDAQVEFRGDSPQGYFRLVPRARSTFFPDDETEETNNQWVNMDLQRRGERSQFDLETQLSRVETLGPLIPTGGIDPGDDLGEPDPGLGGGTGAEVNREERILVAPRLGITPTERYGFEFGAGFLDVSYDQLVVDDREDFQYLYGTLGYLYRLSPQKTVAVRGRVANYENDLGDTTDSQAINVEWSNKISESSEVLLRAGGNRSEDDDGSGWNNGFSGGVGVRWTFEVTELFLDVNSDLDPNSSGQLVQRDQARFQVARRLSEKTTFRVGARYIRDTSADSDTLFNDRDYAVGNIGLAWRFARQWTLGGIYTYVWRDFESDPRSADANRVSIGITYEPNLR
ncbi:MAG: hypothetical protein ACREVI_04405 [Steroidobacteraceae bacterium]